MGVFRRRWFALLAVVVGLGTFAPGIRADEEIFLPPPPPYGPHEAPVYLIISFDDDFIVASDIEGPAPSQTIVVNVGSFVGGAQILDTRFVTAALSQIPLPGGEFDPNFTALQDNSSTILGSFQTTDLAAPHMVTPMPGTVAPDIQVAFFQASNLGLIDDLVSEVQFPTTTQIADVVASQIPDVEGASSYADVLAALFNSGTPLNIGDNGASATGEGDMFPHEPDSPGLFHYHLSFDEDGNFDSDVCLRVGLDIKPGNANNKVNVKKKGTLVVAILSSDHFDARDVDTSTVEIGGVGPTKTSLKDANHDGLEDLVGHWRVEDLVEAGALSADSTELSVMADLEDGSCVVGTDAVHPITGGSDD